MSALPCRHVLWRVYEGAIPTDCELREVDSQWALSVSYRGKSVFRAKYASQRAATAHAQVLRANLLANGWRTQAPRSDEGFEHDGNPDNLYRALTQQAG
jgi:hypothetical protein